jgi:hypothetical protein
MRAIDAVINSKTAMCNGLGTSTLGAHPRPVMFYFPPATLATPLSLWDARISSTFFEWIQNDPTARQILRDNNLTTISISGAFVHLSLKYFESTYTFVFAKSVFGQAFLDHTKFSELTFDSCSITSLNATDTTIDALRVTNSNFDLIDFGQHCVSTFGFSFNDSKIDQVNFTTGGSYGFIEFSADTLGTIELWDSQLDRLLIESCQVTGIVPIAGGPTIYAVAVSIKKVHVMNMIIVAGSTVNRMGLKDSIIDGDFTLRQSTIVADGTSIIDLHALGLTEQNESTAISASGLHAGQDVLLQNMTVRGDTDFSEAIVGWSFKVKDASFQPTINGSVSTDDLRVSATHLQAGRDLLLQGVKLAGAAVFNDAQVQRSFQVEDSSFEPANEGSPSGFFAKGAMVKEDFVWNARLGKGSALDVSDASVGSFEEVGTTRPGPGHLFAQGFTFDNLRFFRYGSNFHRFVARPVRRQSRPSRCV